MIEDKSLAVISILITDDPKLSYQQYFDWKEAINTPITTFDFDNHSDSYTIDLAIKLLDASSYAFIQLDVSSENEEVKGVHRFFNTAIRKYRTKVSVVFNVEHPKLKSYLKVLDAKKYQSRPELRQAVVSWVSRC
ncbi:MAG: hypothetical protein AAGC88_14455 [Bacteroidota bacterium]